MLGSGGRDGHEERVIFRDLVSSRVVYENHLIRAHSSLDYAPYLGKLLIDVGRGQGGLGDVK